MDKPEAELDTFVHGDKDKFIFTIELMVKTVTGSDSNVYEDETRKVSQAVKDTGTGTIHGFSGEFYVTIDLKSDKANIKIFS